METAHHVLTLTARFATALFRPSASIATVATSSTAANSVSSATPQCLAAINVHPKMCVRSAIRVSTYCQEASAVRSAVFLCLSVGRARPLRLAQNVRAGIFWSTIAVSFALPICRAVPSVRLTLSASTAFRATISTVALSNVRGALKLRVV